MSFTGGYALDEKKLKFNETISLGKRVYEAEDWPAFRQAVINQEHFADQKIILKK